MMKLNVTIFLFMIYSVSPAQQPKTKDVHHFFEATLQSIKSADTTAFVKLWSQPVDLSKANNARIDSIAYSERRRIEFKSICSAWRPYLNDLNFEIDCHEKNKKKTIDDALGYEFTICLTSKEKPKSQKYLFIGITFKYIDDRMYCTSLLPMEVVNGLEGK
jgi:hypothetical protein